jgi:hypothetical protein
MYQLHYLPANANAAPHMLLEELGEYGAGVAAALVRLAGGKPATEGRQAPRRAKKEKTDA